MENMKNIKHQDKYVVVRTYSAGVHVGKLESRSSKEVVLSDARRIWSWTGALSLHEIAQGEFGNNSRISCAVSEIELTEAIEIITCSPEGENNLRSYPAWRV
jgi:hypothetical protein